MARGFENRFSILSKIRSYRTYTVFELGMRAREYGAPQL